MPNDRNLLKLAYLERVLSGLSPTNQTHVREYVNERRAEGLKISSLTQIAVCLRHVDKDHAGRALPELTPAELSRSLLHYTTTHEPASATSWAACVRSYYRHSHGGDLPKDIARALKRKHKEEWRDVQPISEQERDALLRAADETPQRKNAIRRQALLWTLWDTGFRVSELLALRIESFEPDEKGGALLRLPKNAPGLKTGPRTIYVVECVGAIKGWLAFHPTRDEPKAPLFPSKNDATQSPWPVNINAMLEELCRRAGIRRINPHLFRHTRATNAAKRGWNEPQLRAYFGWSATSSMAARYVHLSQRNMEDRVREDANMDAIGARFREDPDRALADTIANTIHALDKRGLLRRDSRSRDDQDGGTAPVARG